MTVHDATDIGPRHMNGAVNNKPGDVDVLFAGTRTRIDNVTVNSDDGDLRRNRLLLLGRIRATLDRVADFSRIEG